MRCRRRTALQACVGAAAIGWASLASPQESAQDLRTALERWMEARRLASVERREWQQARELMKDRIEALSRDIEAWKEKITEVESEIQKADRETEELRQKRDALLGSLRAVQEALPGLERRVRELLARSPPPLRQRVQPLAQRVPADPSATRLSVAERTGLLIGILNEMDKFAREVLVANEVLDLPDGTSAEVTVLYFGMACAWYCNAARGLAGIGWPTESGWTWVPRDELATDVARAIAIARGERAAEYVVLPVEVR